MEAPTAGKAIHNFEMPVVSFAPVHVHKTKRTKKELPRCKFLFEFFY